MSFQFKVIIVKYQMSHMEYWLGTLLPIPYHHIIIIKLLFSVKDGKAFIKGEWGSEIADKFKPTSDEVVVEGKKGLDGFCSTNLDFILRSRKINSVAICGFLVKHSLFNNFQ